MRADFDDDDVPEKPKRGQRQRQPSSSEIFQRVAVPIVVAIIGALGLIFASGNGQVFVNIFNTILNNPSSDPTVMTQVAIALTQTQIASGGELSSPIVQPTNLPLATDTPFLRDMPVPVSGVEGLYDDFNNFKYDGSLNRNLWGSAQDITTDAFQQGGMLNLFTTPTTEEQGYIIGFDGLGKGTFTTLQVNMLLGSSTGSNGNVSLGFLSSTIPGGWVEICLCHTGDGNRAIFADGGGKVLPGSKSFEADTWYTIKATFDQLSNTFTFFVNGQQLASYKNPQAVTFIRPIIQIWRVSKYINVAASVDDVYVYE